MSSASSSIEMPALIRRTLDWLRTSLLKGMSRDEDRVIFLTAVAIGMYSATGGRKTLSRPPTRHETSAALFLQEAGAAQVRDDVKPRTRLQPPRIYRPDG